MKINVVQLFGLQPGLWPGLAPRMALARGTKAEMGQGSVLVKN